MTEVAAIICCPVSISTGPASPAIALLSNPPLRGRPQQAAGHVGCLRVAMLRVCAALLASGLSSDA